MSGWEAVRLDDLDAIPVAGVVWRPVRRRLGIRAFGMNAYSAEAAGEQIVEEHDETALGHEEAYVVVRGRVAFTIGGETVEAEAPTVVFVRDPSLTRVGVAQTGDALVLAVGAAPGTAYEPSAWEWSFAASPHLDAGRVDEAVALLEEGLAEHPGSPSLLYHLACAEARAGRRDDARAHLAEAVAAVPRYAERAREDPDLASLRE